MRKFLKAIFVIQEVSNKYKSKKLGRGFTAAIRFNPLNPLSYLVLLLIPIIGIFMFGFIGFWKEIKIQNPFKWN